MFFICFQSYISTFCNILFLIWYIIDLPIRRRTTPYMWCLRCNNTFLELVRHAWFVHLFLTFGQPFWFAPSENNLQHGRLERELLSAARRRPPRPAAATLKKLSRSSSPPPAASGRGNHGNPACDSRHAAAARLLRRAVAGGRAPLLKAWPASVDDVGRPGRHRRPLSLQLPMTLLSILVPFLPSPSLLVHFALSLLPGGAFCGSRWSNLLFSRVFPLCREIKLQAEIWAKLNRPISWPELGEKAFALVVSFGRCRFRLCLDTVALILQATIGGTAAHFKVSCLHDRTFKFFVASKEVGFFIRNLSLVLITLCSSTFGAMAALTGSLNFKISLMKSAGFLDDGL